jgi:hypothetical protein
MKKSQLLAIIDKAINEVLNEASSTYAGKNAVDDLKKDREYSTLSATGKLDAEDELKRGGTVTIGEAELDEARRYGIADAEKAQSLIDAASGKAKGRIQQIVDAINDAGGRLSGGGIANAIGVIQPQINSLLKSMVENGILDIEGGKAFSTTPAPGEEAPEEEPEMAGDYTDFFVGKGDVDKTLAPYFRDEPTSEEEPAIPTRTVSMAAAPKIGVWFDKNSDLIQAIINKTKTSKARVGNSKTKTNEGEEIGGGDLKKSKEASRDWAKESLIKLIDELVAELKKVKQEDPAMYKLILVDLKQYKFGPTGTTSSFEKIMKQLDLPDIEVPSVDAGDLELGDEEEEEDTLPEPIMERLQKLAKIK